MQETKKIDLREIEDVVKDEEDGMVENKESLNSNHIEMDPGRALQLFLDHIPISSIPGLKNSPVLELKTGDSVRDAIHLLYENNIFGAPILDVIDPDTTTGRFSDRYIGFIDFASMLLWSLEECEKIHVQTKGNGGDETGKNGFFTMLEQNPQIGQTKVGELAKSFLWDPFFPVRLDDTLFHVLLLLSKHRLQVLPVTERSDSQVIGFVTQNAVIQLLLQSDGLEWFDNIANKALSEFRFENEHVARVYGDQSIAEALCILLKSQVGIVAVMDRRSQRLIGSIRCSDVYLLLENDNLLHKRESITVEQFIHIQTGKTDSDPTMERYKGVLLTPGVLHLRNSSLPRMDSPVTNKKTDTLKQAMKNLAETKCSFSILVDDSQRVTGVLTLRGILLQFAPPCMDSSIHGGGFFEIALEQSGCHVKNGTIICDH